MAHRVARLTLAAFVAHAVSIGWGEAQSPRPTSAPKADGPVQGYQGGYDPIDKSKAPAAPEGKKADPGNADEGRRGKSVSGAIAAVDGRKLTPGQRSGTRGASDLERGPGNFPGGHPDRGPL